MNKTTALMDTPFSDPEKATSFLISEYECLREELLKIKDLQFQLTNLSLVAAAALFTVSFQIKTSFSSSVAFLLFPPLALFLEMQWGHHANRVVQIAEYIRTRVEPRGLGWEKYLLQKRRDKTVGEKRMLKFGPTAFSVATRGFFFAPALLSVGFATVQSNVAHFSVAQRLLIAPLALVDIVVLVFILTVSLPQMGNAEQSAGSSATWRVRLTTFVVGSIRSYVRCALVSKRA